MGFRETIENQTAYMVGLGLPGAYTWVYITFDLDDAYRYCDEIPPWENWMLIEYPNGMKHYPIRALDYVLDDRTPLTY